MSESEKLFESTLMDLAEGQEISLPFTPGTVKAVLFSVVPHEATVRATISNAHGEVLANALSDQRRGIPLYVLVQPEEPGQPLDLLIEVIASTSAAQVDVNISALPALTRSDEHRLEAYGLYTAATASMPSLDHEAWRERMGQLERASHLFDDLQMPTPALWSRFLSVAIAYYPLLDRTYLSRHLESLTADAAATGHHDIEILARQVAGQALMFRQMDRDAESSAADMQAAVAAFEATSTLAEEHGLHFQAAWAVNNAGIAHHYRGDYRAAIAAWHRAAHMGASLNDPYLDNILRSNEAASRQQLGEHAEALALLETVIEHQASRHQEMELSFSLDRLGDTHTQLYQFNEAIAAYDRAITLAEQRSDGELLGFLHLSRANAQLELGEVQAALASTEAAIDFLVSEDAAAGLYRAQQTAADIHRVLGQHEQARTMRGAMQAATEREAALQRFEQGKDRRLMARAGTHDTERLLALAREDFEAAVQSAGETGLDEHAQLAALYLCDLATTTSQDCDWDDLSGQVSRLVAEADPRVQVEALLVSAELLQGRNEPALALSQLNRLVDVMSAYRGELQGVTRAWFWQGRSDILRQLVDLQVKEDLGTGRSARSFVLLDRLRNTGLYADSAGSASPEPDAEAKLRSLAGHLPANTSVLTFYFSTSGVYRWLLDDQGLQLEQVSQDTELEKQLALTLSNLRVTGYAALDSELARLGDTLLAGLDDRLGDNLYIMAGGPLNGFPADALRFRDRYLVEAHNVAILHTINRPRPMEDGHWPPRSLWMAGAPDTAGSGFIDLAATREELERVGSAFPQAGVSAATGPNFTADRMGDTEFLQADLLHIASHAQLNLAAPEQSRILTSPRDGETAGFITPSDLRTLDLAARLVTLSACETSGSNRFRFDSNLGFVSEFLDAGAANVVASLSPVPDRVTAELMGAFYDHLGRGEPIIRALAMAKRDLATRNPPATWAAFQLVSQSFIPSASN